jgi:hypothetical protein
LDHALKADVAHFLTRPVTEGNLLEALEQALTSGRPARPGEEGDFLAELVKDAGRIELGEPRMSKTEGTGTSKTNISRP